MLLTQSSDQYRSKTHGVIQLWGAVFALFTVLLGELNTGLSQSNSAVFLSYMLTWALLFTALSILLSMWLSARHYWGACGQGASSSSTKKMELPLSAIVFWAVVLRLIGLSYEPIFEDDHFRYMWDGFMLATSGNPYGIAPSEFFGDERIPVAIQGLLDGINYPDTPTIYGPIFQLSFALAYFLAPANVGALQLLYTLADIGVILLLARMAKPAAVLLYAWCPLVIKEFAFTAHADILAILLMLAGIYCWTQRRDSSAAVFLGLAVAAKVFAILVVPLLLLRMRVRYWLLFSVTLALSYAPFVWQNSTDLAGLFAFASDWQFNGFIHPLLLELVANLGLDAQLAKLLCALVFVACYAVYACHYLITAWGRNTRTIPRGDWIFCLFFLLAPVLNAWYWPWVLVFAVLYPRPWAWVASFAVMLSYITGGNLDAADMGLYQQPQWARATEYVLICAALAMDCYAELKGRAKGKSYRAWFTGTVDPKKRA